MVLNSTLYSVNSTAESTQTNIIGKWKPLEFFYKLYNSMKWNEERDMLVKRKSVFVKLYRKKSNERERSRQTTWL